MRFLVFLFVTFLSYHSWANDLASCEIFIKSEVSNVEVHNYQPCLNSANSGHVAAQYSVAMSYEQVNENELAHEYYLKAANKEFAPAILALGHMHNDLRPWKAIYWYQRYFDTGEQGSGYVAILIANIFQRLELTEQSEYWIKQCSTTSYTGCIVTTKQSGI